jgi:hypothetical protein
MIQIQFVATVTTNWYAIRIESTGELLAVGWWLPPQSENVLAERVTEEEAMQLLEELKAKAAAMAK